MTNNRAIHMLVAMLGLGESTALAQSPLGTGFTYQGRLATSGDPANGSYDMRFSLYDALTFGSLAAPPTCADNVTVTDGLFTVQLDFGAAAFDGDARWMAIEVRSDAVAGNCNSGLYEELSPRQALTPVPYAISLHLPYNATANVQNGAPVHVINSFSGPLFTGYGLWGESPHPLGRGVYGVATSATGSGAGTYGESHSPNGFGTFGFASATTGGNFGVFGRSDSALGTGVFGRTTANSGTTYAVRGQCDSASGYAGYFTGGRNFFEGNVGIGTSDPTNGKLEILGANYGVYSRATSTSSGAGVYGSGKYGVFGLANDAAGFGGVFSGNGSFGSGNALWVTGIARIGDRLNIGGSSLTATPAARLHIENGDDTSLLNNGFVVFGDTSGANISIDNNEIMARNNGQSSSLFLNNDGGNVNLIATGTGNVGIGTSAPQYKLDVDGAIRPLGGIYFNGALPPYQNAQGGNFLSFGHPGNSEDHIWYYNNNFFFYDSPGGGDAAHPNITADDFYTWSDIRLKTDIEPIAGALDKVRALRGIRYRFDPAKIDPLATIDPAQPSRTRLGFSAQEVERVVPEAATYMPEVDAHAVSYGSIVPLLVEAIKEQQTQIEGLRAEIAALRNNQSNGEGRR